MKNQFALTLGLALLATSCAVGGSAPPPSETLQPEVEARSTLESFLQYLHDGQYTDAVLLYGGPWDTMRDHNPSVPPNDRAALMRNACEVNGAACLTPRSITLQQVTSGREFRFMVEFQYDDGSLFTRGPCCGASPTDDPPQSDFSYTVAGDAAGRLLVMDMPPYTP